MIHPSAQQFVGIEFEEGGRGCAKADCLGIVLMFLWSINIKARDPWGDVCRSWNAGSQDAAEYALPGSWEPVDSDDLKVGDVGITSKGDHVAVYVGDGTYLHSRKRSGSVLDELRRKVETFKTWRRWKE